MTRRLLILAVAVFAASFTDACTNSSDASLSPRDRDMLDWWLTCIECEPALDTLRALGSRDPGPTVEALNVALRVGPGPTRITSAESALVIAYVRDSTYAVRTSGPLPPPRPLYVSTASARYADGYRSRGAIGLGWLHTPQAVTYLQAALGDTLPPTVRTAARYALDSLPRQ